MQKHELAVRAVLDTNCVISGFFWRGQERSLLDLARAGRVDLFTSSHLIAELATVLARPKFEPRLQAAQVRPQQLVQGYIALAHVMRNPPTIYRVCRDPNDDQVSACALAARADLIVSGDKDLLVLGNYRRIPILSSSAALTFIAAPPSP